MFLILSEKSIVKMVPNFVLIFVLNSVPNFVRKMSCKYCSKFRNSDLNCVLNWVVNFVVRRANHLDDLEQTNRLALISKLREGSAFRLKHFWCNHNNHHHFLPSLKADRIFCFSRLKLIKFCVRNNSLERRWWWRWWRWLLEVFFTQVLPFAVSHE